VARSEQHITEVFIVESAFQPTDIASELDNIHCQVLDITKENIRYCTPLEVTQKRQRVSTRSKKKRKNSPSVRPEVIKSAMAQKSYILYICTYIIKHIGSLNTEMYYVTYVLRIGSIVVFRVLYCKTDY